MSVAKRARVNFLMKYSRSAIDLVVADISKDENYFSCIRVLLDMKGENELGGNVPFPNVRMSLHFSDAERRMERRMFSAALEQSERLSRSAFHRLRKLGIRKPKRFGGAKLHLASRKSSILSIVLNVRTRPAAMA